MTSLDQEFEFFDDDFFKVKKYDNTTGRNIEYSTMNDDLLEEEWVFWIY